MPHFVQEAQAKGVEPEWGRRFSHAGSLLPVRFNLQTVTFGTSLMNWTTQQEKTITRGFEDGNLAATVELVIRIEV